MGLIKEPKSIDFSTSSEPWTAQELSDFRKIMQDIRAKNTRRKEKNSLLSQNKINAAGIKDC